MKYGRNSQKSQEPDDGLFVNAGLHLWESATNMLKATDNDRHSNNVFSHFL